MIYIYFASPFQCWNGRLNQTTKMAPTLAHLETHAHPQVSAMGFNVCNPNHLPKEIPLKILKNICQLLSRLSALLQSSIQFPGRAFPWTWWKHATPAPLLLRSLSTCNLALSLEERLQRHSLANSHDTLRPSTIISLLQCSPCLSTGSWSSSGCEHVPQQDLLEYECWRPMKQISIYINLIHVAGLMQVQIPTWFNGNLETSSKNLLGIWMLIPNLPGTAGNNQRGLNACRAKHPFPNYSVLARMGSGHPNISLANTALPVFTNLSASWLNSQWKHELSVLMHKFSLHIFEHGTPRLVGNMCLAAMENLYPAIICELVFPWSRPRKSYVPMEHSKEKCLWSMYRTKKSSPVYPNAKRN